MPEVPEVRKVPMVRVLTVLVAEGLVAGARARVLRLTVPSH